LLLANVKARANLARITIKSVNINS
jgi:hypothetical protein